MERVKQFIHIYQTDIVLAAGIILVSIISFGLGRLSAISKAHIPMRIEETSVYQLRQGTSTTSTFPGSPTSPTNSAELVASKNGLKYYHPWCTGASRIKDANKITFSSEDEAKAAGYELAANCH